MKDKIQRIYTQAIKILEEVGIKLKHTEILTLYMKVVRYEL
jgi:trimethylamine:corrinoid methyltransferase-like protein